MSFSPRAGLYLRAVDLHLGRRSGALPPSVPSMGEVSFSPAKMMASGICTVLWALLKSKVCSRIEERRELFLLQRWEVNWGLKRIYSVLRGI